MPSAPVVAAAALLTAAAAGVSLVLELFALDGWAKRTPWYITELISRLTTRELSPLSPKTT